jgi:4-diphosphocytidyl-2C-methyl-D-erythritol kinase
MLANTADLTPITVFAPAKVNLYLHVVGRRDDGYHLLDSLVVFAAEGAEDGGDTIAVALADDLTLAIDGPFAAGLPADRSNLVLQAADALAAAASPAGGDTYGAAIRLTKRLPLASGIGGGSADAAATLRALARLWDVRLPPEDLAALALRLGADLPMCLASRPAFIGGIGEAIDPPPSLPPCWLVLANPGVSLPTPAVFRARSGPFSPPGRFETAPADAAALAELLSRRGNDLAAPAIGLCPVIGDVLDALAGCDGALLSRMSGSGATCFALFGEARQATASAALLRGRRPGWWVTSVRVAGEDDSV